MEACPWTGPAAGPSDSGSGFGLGNAGSEPVQSHTGIVDNF